MRDKRGYRWLSRRNAGEGPSDDRAGLALHERTALGLFQPGHNSGHVLVLDSKRVRDLGHAEHGLGDGILIVGRHLPHGRNRFLK
ncbi:hypothetical protein MKK67_29995 [Methylobacterium sp. J-072]|uniref:hypothetical protein n=1 Tax=Methylobacterium sp. J-072 TaxID=2836651 RepID=UPI001FB9377D|nr:hypothetical protein [Methylobacterium sp. J-072]MCJ2096705.1 hypothetical protein [Methylobacterium sp. J-072]